MTSLLLKYFPDLGDKQKDQLAQLENIYRAWNEKINVISRKDIDHLYERHVLHSLAIAKIQSFGDGQNILDVGTGGGFPGIPLAVLYPNAHFHLVDSIAKKLKVIDAVATTIGLRNVTTKHERMEKLKGQYDFIVSRAVAKTQQLCHWTHHLLSDHPDASWLLLKGGDLDAELAELKRPHSVHSLANFFEEPFFETKKIVRVL